MLAIPDHPYRAVLRRVGDYKLIMGNAGRGGWYPPPTVPDLEWMDNPDIRSWEVYMEVFADEIVSRLNISSTQYQLFNVKGKGILQQAQSSRERRK